LRAHLLPARDAVPDLCGCGRDRHGNGDDGDLSRDLGTAPGPVLNLDLTSCSGARLPGIGLNANKTQTRTAHRSFAAEDRGLARTSAGCGRMTSSATRE
jgi:hypothetical protein